MVIKTWREEAGSENNHLIKKGDRTLTQEFAARPLLRSSRSTGSLFTALFRRRRHSRLRRSRHLLQGGQELESRQLLAFVGAPTLSSGLITVNADGGNDLIEVYFDDTTDQVVVANGLTTPPTLYPFNVSTVTNGVRVNAGGGDDYVDTSRLQSDFYFGFSNTMVTIFSGPGNDTVLGSPYKDLLQGESGDDLLVGGEGADTLNGGLQASDVLDGGLGKDLFDTTGQAGQKDWRDAEDASGTNSAPEIVFPAETSMELSSHEAIFFKTIVYDPEGDLITYDVDVFDGATPVAVPSAVDGIFLWQPPEPAMHTTKNYTVVVTATQLINNVSSGSDQHTINVAVRYRERVPSYLNVDPSEIVNHDPNVTQQAADVRTFPVVKQQSVLTRLYNVEAGKAARYWLGATDLESGANNYFAYKYEIGERNPFGASIVTASNGYEWIEIPNAGGEVAGAIDVIIIDPEGRKRHETVTYVSGKDPQLNPSNVTPLVTPSATFDMTVPIVYPAYNPQNPVMAAGEAIVRLTSMKEKDANFTGNWIDDPEAVDPDHQSQTITYQITQMPPHGTLQHKPTGVGYSNATWTTVNSSNMNSLSRGNLRYVPDPAFFYKQVQFNYRSKRQLGAAEYFSVESRITVFDPLDVDVKLDFVPCDCVCGCAGGNAASRGSVNALHTLPNGLTINYDSGRVLTPAIGIKAEVNPWLQESRENDNTVYHRIENRLTLDNAPSTTDTVFYEGGNLLPGDQFEAGGEFKAVTLSPGTHKYDLVTLVNTNKVLTKSGTFYVPEDDYATFGTGWQIDGLDRLKLPSSTPLGQFLWVTDSGAQYTANAVGSMFDDPDRTVVSNGSGGTYVLTNKYGEKRTFDAAGKHLATADATGTKQKQFNYTSGRITSIVDRNGNSSNFTYASPTSNRITAVTDASARITNFTYNHKGQLLQIMSPDPDGSGTEYSSPITRFAYTNKGELTHLADPNANLTRYEFDENGHRTRQRNADFGVEHVRSQRAVGIPSAYGIYGSTSSELPLKSVPQFDGRSGGATGITRDAAGNTTRSSFDRWGRPLTVRDSIGNVTTILRNDFGQETMEIEPDADGPFGPLNAAVTLHCYNCPVANRDATWDAEDVAAYVTQYVALYKAAYDLKHPNKLLNEADYKSFVYQNFASLLNPTSDPLFAARYGVLFNPKSQTPTESAIYDATFNRPIEEVNEIGAKTKYTLDASTGLTLTERLIVGTEDPGMTGDDVVSTFTYTPTPATSNSLPGGLLLTSTDPLGFVTRYTYFDNRTTDGIKFGLLKTIEQAYGTSLVLTTTYNYDADGNLNVESNGLGTTNHDYDKLGRLKRTQLPDPDGAAALPRPSTSFRFDAVGNIIEEKDVLNRITTHAYDRMNQRIRTTEPDPDDMTNEGGTNGPLTSPILEWHYDLAGRLDWSEDALDRRTVITYDALGRTKTTTLPDPDGTGTQYTQPLTTTVFYDAVGNVIQETDPLGNSTRHEYNVSQQRIKTILQDPDGSGGSQLSPVQEWSYVNGQLIYSRDELNRQTDFYYDAIGRRYRTLLPDPDGSGTLLRPATEVLLNENNQALEERVGWMSGTTFVVDRTTIHELDALGRTKKTTFPDPDGTGVGVPAPFAEWSYAATTGLLAWSKDTLARRTDYQYDNLGRVTKVILPDPLNAADDTNPNDADRPKLQRTYDSVGNLATETDARGYVTSFVYDRLRRQTKVNLPDPDNLIAEGGANGPLVSSIVESAYDAAGQRTSSKDALGQTTTYSYLQTGWLKEIVTPVPMVSNPAQKVKNSYTYDLMGNTLTETDGAGKVTTHHYDQLYREDWKREAHQSVGNEIEYRYYANGQVKSLTDPDNNLTQFFYDNLDRPSQEISPQNVSSFFAYDNSGFLYRETDRLGRVVQYTHDKLGRRTNEIWYASTTAANANQRDRTFTWNYDAGSQLLEVFDTTPAGATISRYAYSYDRLGRETTRTNAQTANQPTVSFVQQFDRAGNRIDIAATITTNSVAQADYKNIYTFDAMGRMSKVKQQSQAGGNAVAEKVAKFTYDAASNLDRVQRYADLAETIIAVDGDYVRDSYGRLSGLSYTNPNNRPQLTQLASYVFTFDDAGRISRNTYTNRFGTSDRQDVNYVYDDSGQLKQVKDNDLGQAVVENYVYNPNGNRSSWTAPTASSTSTTVQVNQLREDTTYSYQYDNEGNLIKRITKVSGAPTGVTFEYQWDSRNRLARTVKKVSPSATGTIQIVDQLYDAYDQWIGRIVDPDGSAGNLPIQRTYFIHDRGQMVLQVDDSLSGTPAKLTHRYLWGPAVDQILAEETHVKQGVSNPSWTQVGTVFWPLTDHLGTVRDLAQVYGYSASSGLPSRQTQIVKHREYDGFGNVVSEWNRADFNGDGKVNVLDVDSLTSAIISGSTNLLYDLNGDGAVNRTPGTFHDMDEMVLVILNTYYGDANLDGEFNSSDQVQVFASGEYNDTVADNSGWGEGDWNGDQDFTDADLTHAMQYGGYNQPSRGGGAYDVYRDMLGFTARPFDTWSGLQNNLHRWYDARSGRWLNEDPIEFAGGDVNLYRYVGNRVVNAIDPAGLSDKWWPVGNKSGVAMRNTAAEPNGFIVIGFLGNGSQPLDTTTGIYKSLTPTANLGKYDVAESTYDGEYQEVLRERIDKQLEAARQRKDCKMRVVILGHSYGGHAAIKAADWFDKRIKDANVTPDIYLVTIDAVKNDGKMSEDGLAGKMAAVTEGPTSKVSHFENHYQENGIHGAAIRTADNTKHRYQLIQRWADNKGGFVGQSAHMIIDNYVAEQKRLEKKVEAWAKEWHK